MRIHYSTLLPGSLSFKRIFDPKILHVYQGEFISFCGFDSIINLLVIKDYKINFESYKNIKSFETS